MSQGKSKPTIVVRRGDDWYGAAIPLHLIVNGKPSGTLPKRGDSGAILLDEPGQYTIVATLGWCRSRPRRVLLTEAQTIHLIYRLPQYPLPSAIFDRNFFGSLEAA